MKYIMISVLVLIPFPAYADYQSGYDAGYYQGSISSDHTSDYGRGVDDGNYDAYLEDRQRAQDEENAVLARRQAAYDSLAEQARLADQELANSVRNLERQADEYFAQHPDEKPAYR